MNEYVVTITVYRSTRREGDTPRLIIGTSSAIHDQYNVPSNETILLALASTVDIIKTALTKQEEVGNG